MSMFYIAYGSNLSVEQMAFRCPGAVIVGKGVLKNWRLAFGAHATIERCEGAEVPVLIWEISDQDERSLDRYEGYPRYYYKDWMLVDVTDLEGENHDTVLAMVYIMTGLTRQGTPTDEYVDTIWEGYVRFGFDLDVLRAALYEVM